MARNDSLFAISVSEPFLATEALIADSKTMIEVYLKAILFVEIELKVNGSYLAGAKLT